MKKTIISALFLGLITLAFAGPKYDANYKLISKSYTINDDGSIDYHFRKELQLFTYPAFDKFGETLIWYNPDFQTLTINESYTIRKDGSKVETPSNAFNPSLPETCTDCERFNNIREMVVTHTALEYDAIIVLDYTIHSNNFFLSELMDKVILAEAAPIERYEVSVNMPRNCNIYSFLNYYDKNKTEAESFNQDSSRHIASWTFTNLPQTSADAYQLPIQTPYLMLTTLSSPSSIVDKMVKQNAFMLPESTLFKETIEPLMEGKKTEMEKIIAVRNYVADNIHTNHVPLHYLNYVMASPVTVWNTNCGTAVEKDLLLQAILSSFNITTTFGLLLNDLWPDPQSMLRVLINNEYYYLSATNKSALSLEVGKVGDTFIPFSKEMLVTFNQRPIHIDIQADMRINKPTDDVEVSMKRNTIQSPYTHYLTPRETKACSANCSKVGANYYQVNIDKTVGGSTLNAAYLSQYRKLPVFANVTDEYYVYQITLPAGARWLTQPTRIEKSYDDGSMVIDIAIDGQVLTLTRKLTIKDSVIPVKQYKKFRSMMSEWNAARNLIFSTK